MSETIRKKYEKNIFILFEIIAAITTFFCLYKARLDSKIFLCILPFGFFMISFIFKQNFKCITDNISKLLIVSLFFVRIVVLPFLYSNNISTQLFEGKNSIELYFSKACLLMVYEYFVVQLTLYICEHKRKRVQFKIKHFTSNVDISKIFVIGLTVYILVIALFLPQYSENFKTIFRLGDADFAVATLKAEYNIGTIGRILKTLFSMAVQLFRILFPAFLMRQFFNHNSKSRGCTLILVVSCILQFMFLTSTFAEAIVSCLALTLFYIKLYPLRKKRTFLFLCLATLGMLILYFVVRYFVNTTVGLYSKDNGAINYAAQIINAYFTGVDNVAAIFNIPSGYERKAFRADILGAIPFNSTLFVDRGNKLQYYYNFYNRAYGQIPPTIGVGYYYFGELLSPIITVLFVILSMKYYKKAEYMNVSLKYVALVFCSVVFALGTVMYSPSITMSWYFSWGIPMLLLTLFTDSGNKEKCI